MKKKIVEEQELSLTSSELADLELKLNRRLVKKLELEKQDLLLQNIKLQSEVYRFKIVELNQKSTEIQGKKANNFKQYMLADKEYKEYIKMMQEKYQIDSKNWGYNPDTGKIILDS